MRERVVWPLPSKSTQKRPLQTDCHPQPQLGHSVEDFSAHTLRDLDLKVVILVEFRVVRAPARRRPASKGSTSTKIVKSGSVHYRSHPIKITLDTLIVSSNTYRSEITTASVKAG